MKTNNERPYGVGLAYRTLLHEQILKRSGEIDFLEISTEDYLVRQRRIWADPQARLLDEVVDRFPCVAHGLSLSLGSVEPLERQYLDGTARFLRKTGIQHFSEHLAYHRMDGTDLTMFLSMPFDGLSLAWLQRNYAAVRQAIGMPFALENVSYYFPIPDSQYQEPEFLRELLLTTDCTLLLDVTNVFNNCTNHGEDPYRYIHTLPGDRISQIHLAGGHFEEDLLIDSHSYPVMAEVWDLYEEALRHTAAEIVILERDENFRPYAAIFDDLAKARELFHRHRPSVPPEPGPAPLSASKAATGAPDPLAPEFADLRNLQRAIIRQLTDDAFLRRARRNPESVLDDYPMSEAWLQRFRNCSPRAIDRMANSWHGFHQEDRRAAEDYRRMEWQQWARVLEWEQA